MNDTSLKLFELASTQHGFFTATQAINCGYPRNNHTYHVHARNWEKVGHGVYRLVKFPQDNFDYLMPIYFWTRNKEDEIQGIFSHETALDIYELCDISPREIHLSVPKSFRNKIPDNYNSIELHKRDLSEIETKEIEGIRVTTPLQTLLDVITIASIDEKLVVQAVNQAFERGLIMIKQFKNNEMLNKYLRGKNVIKI